MASTQDSLSKTCNNIQMVTDLPTVTTTTKTEFVGYDGKILRSTVDTDGKPLRIHKVITTTTTVTCLGEDFNTNENNDRPTEKFVEHVKELGVDTKDVLIQTATGVQHAIETAGDYIRTQLGSATASGSSDGPTKDTSNRKEQTTDLLHQAAVIKDVIVQKAMEVKDATVDVIKDLTTPPEEQKATVHFDNGTNTVTTEKKTE